jgi:hypothetical protein
MPRAYSEADQGYYPSERDVTYDLQLVLRIARHYTQTGELDRSVHWEP